MLATGDGGSTQIENVSLTLILRYSNFAASDPLILVRAAVAQLVMMLSLFKGLMACATHFFFARRIYIITENIWLSGLICLFGVGTLGTPFSVALAVNVH